MLSSVYKRIPQEFCLLALWPALRPTNRGCMGPVFSHNAGDRCVIIKMLCSYGPTEYPVITYYIVKTSVVENFSE